MAKPVVKEFNVFCHYDEVDNKPIYHKVTIDKKGSVKLHGHPEIKSEVFYHLLMVQKVKASKTSYYSDKAYDVSGCLQFYFSLIHKKFEDHLKGIYFRHLHEDAADYLRGDNRRLEDYLEKIRIETRNRERFNREDVWSEKVFYAKNLASRDGRLKAGIRDLFYKSIEKMPRYVTSLDISMAEDSEDLVRKFSYIRWEGKDNKNYHFSCQLTSRCSTKTDYRGRTFMRDGYMNVSLYLTKDWFKNVKRKNLASISSEKHGKLFVVDAKPYKKGYLIDAITPASGTKKGYVIQNFYIEQNVVTFEWNVTRKNNVKEKSTAQAG